MIQRFQIYNSNLNFLGTQRQNTEREMNEANSALHEAIRGKKKMILLEIALNKKNKHVDLKSKVKEGPDLR